MRDDSVSSLPVSSALRLQEKLATAAWERSVARYFSTRIVPALLLWGAVVAAIHFAAGDKIPLGASLTLLFMGAAVIVMGLARRARRQIPRVSCATG
jgi:hypothetical protein